MRLAPLCLEKCLALRLEGKTCTLRDTHASSAVCATCRARGATCFACSAALMTLMAPSHVVLRFLTSRPWQCWRCLARKYVAQVSFLGTSVLPVLDSAASFAWQ